MEEGRYLFVYGTLRQGSGRPMAGYLARHARRVGRATMKGRLYDLGGYPGAVPSDSLDDGVVGEVYLLDSPEAVLRALDEYEGCGPEDPPPTEYRRQRVTVRMEDGRRLQAWAYIYNRPTDGLRPIPSGDFLSPQGPAGGGSA